MKLMLTCFRTRLSRAFRFFCFTIACYGLYIIINLSFHKDVLFKGLKVFPNNTTLESSNEEIVSASNPLIISQTTVHYHSKNVSNDSIYFDHLESVKNFKYLKNCGLKFECSEDEFPVHLYSGSMNLEGPKMCINHQYSALPSFTRLGRGFNVAAVDPKVMKVLRFGNFDTYKEDSKNLEIFLELLDPGYIVIAVVYDDAALRLSASTRDMFIQLGSSLIHNLAFRDVWVFVGRKGLVGFSPFEQIEYAIKGWPKPINLKKCINKNFEGVKARSDDVRHANEDRREFCFNSQFDNNFCKAENIDNPLTSSLLFDPTLEKHLIFQTPIIIVPGPDVNVFRMQMEALLLNPGISLNLIHVFVPETEVTMIELATLLNLQVHLLHNMSFSNDAYSVIFLNSFEESWKKFNSQYMIFIEEYVIPSNNFLSFMAQCLDILSLDHSLWSASAWNPLGLSLTPSNEKRAIRSGLFPGLGFIINRRVYNSHLKHHIHTLYHKSSLDGWTIFNETIETILPEVSRVYRAVINISSNVAPLFLNQITSIDHKLETKLENIFRLIKRNYSQYIHELISRGNVISKERVDQYCLNVEQHRNDTKKKSKLVVTLFDSSVRSHYIIHYVEANERFTSSALNYLLSCLIGFNLYQHHNLFNSILNEHLIKLSLKGNDVFLIESTSPYKL